MENKHRERRNRRSENRKEISDREKEEGGKTDVRIIQINDEERHTEAKTTWSFLSLILYLCTTLNKLSLKPRKC